MDPHRVLGVPPAAAPDEVGRAYRDLAKRFHPDRRPGDAGAAARMAAINAAYALLRDRPADGGGVAAAPGSAGGAATGGAGGGRRDGTGASGSEAAGGRGGATTAGGSGAATGGGTSFAPGPGVGGLAGDVGGRRAQPGRSARGGDAVADPRVRRALGPELLAVLAPDEPVHVVTDAATWDSPRVRLAVTDRRLVWLLVDAPVERVRALPWRKVAAADGRLRGRLRRTGELRVQPRVGRRVTFAELEPDALQLLLARIRAHVPT